MLNTTYFKILFILNFIKKNIIFYYKRDCEVEVREKKLVIKIFFLAS